MKWKHLVAFTVIFGAAIILLLPAALNAQGTSVPFPSDQISKEESKIIKDEAVTFGQILFLYATQALEKPPDLRLCAYEMFRLKPNENSCRDKHSSWNSKEEFALLESDIEGEFGGVGLEVTDKDGKILVVSPIDGTPAFRAGFKPEDVIVKIENKPVLNLKDAVTRLRGKPSTSVEITVKRGSQEITFNIVREVIEVHAVSIEIIDNPSGAIGHVKVKIFSEIMPEEFRKEMTNLRNKGVSKVILDFRNNPGGLLNSALDILYDFALPNDVLMVKRQRNKEIIFDTNFVAPMLGPILREPGIFHNLKIVVLINKGSASASEIFAGAMKDWGFLVVGSRSLRKGVGQTVIPLANGSMLKLTTFEFLVGNSKTKINEVGVIPTYEVPDPALSSAAETLRQDRQLKKAIEILSQ